MEPAWRNTKLSLERPYKDDNGHPIRTLLDITQDGQFIYEPREEGDAKLGERFRRIFTERGIDFFDSDPASRYGQESLNTESGEHGIDRNDDQQDADSPEEQDVDVEAKFMTPEMLFKMRSEILPRLHVALGEMSHARDLLSLLLSASAPPPSASSVSTLTAPSTLPVSSLNSALTPGLLTASTVSTLPPILSVQAFDAQLVTGGKDGALRRASDVLRVAAEGIERSTARSEDYWADALRIRRANWGLITAPLPLGAPTGKGADKTSKDFLVSYGLEQSPPMFRRNAIAHMTFYATPSVANVPLVFPHRNRTRLRVNLTRRSPHNVASACYSRVKVYPEDTLHGAIKGAQKEVVEKEIFDGLIKEAGNLPTASARVSERLIVIDAAHDVELRFELIDEDIIASSNSSTESLSDTAGLALCDLIAASLSVLLLRQHAHTKSVRLGLSTALLRFGVNTTPNNLFRTQTPQILQPIIDLLQYHVFLARVRAEFERSVEKLRGAGVKVHLRFEGVGETGKEVVYALIEGREKIVGEAVLRIDERHTVRFTFTSPSTLTVHLPQATITVVSISQLTQLLNDEIERSLLGRICDIGIESCQALSGAWFVDEMSCRAVGRWEGCVLNFRVRCTDDLTLDCHANQLLRTRPHPPTFTSFSASQNLKSAPASAYAGGQTLLAYSARENRAQGLFAWVRSVIEDTLTSSC